jgi:hypothetical protein
MDVITCLVLRALLEPFYFCLLNAHFSNKVSYQKSVCPFSPPIHVTRTTHCNRLDFTLEHKRPSYRSIPRHESTWCYFGLTIYGTSFVSGPCMVVLKHCFQPVCNTVSSLRAHKIISHTHTKQLLILLFCLPHAANTVPCHEQLYD